MIVRVVRVRVGDLYRSGEGGKTRQRAREGAKKALNMIIMGKSGEGLEGGGLEAGRRRSGVPERIPY